MKTKRHEIDMCNGPLLRKILLFAFPLILSNILQLLFNAADMVVVGRFVGPQALAAVGATGSLTNLLLNIFMGISVGVNVTVARAFGSNNKISISESVHTSIGLALISGVILVIVGQLLSRPMLVITGAPADVIDQSTLYMRIYFAGIPIIMLYNFGSAILRAVGDTQRPLYYLSASGVLNVVLNVIFVTQLGMGVEGVALATVLSQVLAVILLLRALMKTEGAYKLELKKIRIHKRKLIQIIRIGIPAGIQGMTFSISNVLIQSSINSFGSIAVAGSTAASNVEGFVYTTMNALYQTSLSFTSQNFGAGKLDRIKRLIVLCIICTGILGLLLGNAAYIFGNTLLGFYSTDAEVIRYGIMKLQIISTTYFLCGIMEALAGTLRGMGCSITPMLVSICGVCGLRVLWIFTVFREYRTLSILYLSYPITWIVTIICHTICLCVVYKNTKKNLKLNGGIV